VFNVMTPRVRGEPDKAVCDSHVRDVRTWRTGDVLAVTVLSTIAIVRTLPFLVFARFHLDSDQAIFGLMAIDLANLRAVPIVMYGQSYMLTVVSWLAAPLFALFGPSAWLLKAPFVPINVACSVLLFGLARRSSALSAANAFVVAATLAVPTVAMASAFTLASGGHVEPVLYTLLLFAFRGRAIALPLLAAFAICHREYVAAAVPALMVLDLLEPFHPRQFAARWLRFTAICAGGIAIVRMTAWAVSTNYASSGPLYQFTANPATNLSWLWRHIGVVLGAEAIDVHDLGLPISFSQGSPIAGIALAILAGLSATAVARMLRARRVEPADRFAIFLLTTCVGVAGAFAFRHSEHGPALVRYLYLLALLPASLAALCLRTYRAGAARWATYASVGALVVLNGWSNTQYGRALLNARLVDVDREIVVAMTERGFRYGLATYWTAYKLAFRSGGALHVSSNEVERIPQYQREYRTHPGEGFRIGGGPCTAGTVTVRDVSICVFEPRDHSR
jgi:hypothetical protein